MATVKICGLMREETAAAIAALPIDHVGFIFAPSKRRVSPQQAAAMIERLAAGRNAGAPAPLAFGVFVNPGIDELADALAIAPLDVVQLHGDEPPEFCREVKARFGVRVYRAFAAAESGAANGAPPEEALARYAGSIDGMLLDTAGGGTGQTFEWSRIPAYAAWAAGQGIPLLVAGGLHPDNVAELLAAYKPDGVDVSSGVETDGHKDIAKITQFVERVKRHESHASAG